MSTLGNLQINGRATQSLPAQNPNDLIRLGEALQLLRSQLAGSWSSVTTFTQGMLVSDDNAVYLLQAASSLNQKPSANPSVWTLVLAGGVDGSNGAGSWFAFASDNAGTGFSLTPGSGLTYIGFATGATQPNTVGAYSGWTKFVGTNGSDGANGSAGTGSWFAFASDNAGTGFSLSPTGLTYIGFATGATQPNTVGAYSGWTKFVGTNGSNGSAGTNGTSSWFAFASDNAGTGFSLTPGSGLTYIGFGTGATQPNTVGAYSGWTQFVGATGGTGATGATGAAGQSVYPYIAYASDTSGTGFSLTPGTSLNCIAFLLSTTVISSPTASNFTGLWKQYVSTISSVTSPLTLSGGALGINAASANTANYIVQRDGSGNFTAGTATLTSVVVGSATLSYSSSALQINTPVVMSALTIGTLSGILQATAGVVSGGATTDNVPEGSTNLYFTQTRVRATPLTGISSTNVLLATDTVLSAFGKLDNILGGNFPTGTVSGNFSVSGNLSVTGTATLGTLSGVLKATNGLVTGGATTDNLTEGSTNLYFTNARVDSRITSTWRNIANGVAPLDSSGKVPLANLYAYGATPYGASSQSAMLALSAAKQGDICLRSDTNIAYILANNTPGVLSNWNAWVYPVSSVNGATGAITLTTDQIGEGSTNLYFTNARVDSRITANWKGAASGLCPLDANQLVPAANLPPIGNGLWIVNSQSTQTNLTSALKGDIANRTDQNLSYVLSNNTPTSFASWVPLLYPVSSVNGATGTVVLTTTNIAEGTNLYFTNARAIAATLTSFTAGAGTVTSSDTLLTALQKVAANAAAALPATGGTLTGVLNFSGTSNRGLVVNQLSTSQIGSLASTSGFYGTIVYDVTLNQLKALVNGSWVSLASGASLPLAAGSGSVLTGALYFQDGLTSNIQFGNVWSCRTSSSNANFDFLNSGTVAATIDSSNNLHVPNGWYDTGSGGGLKLNGNQVVYLSGGRPLFNFGGSFQITTTGSYAALNLSYGGYGGITLDQSNNVSLSAELHMGSYKVIDASNYFYDSGGHKILSAQQTASADFTAAGGWGDATAYADFGNLVTKVNDILAKLRAHGLIAT